MSGTLFICEGDFHIKTEVFLILQFILSQVDFVNLFIFLTLAYLRLK